ncbi:MAG: 50S ribosomal protein L11 methyltransferase, partial [Phascolarctobacterium sp.]|nr:50S ribosomal protein L11 methyltransferase [Phascolarctobacterium sp.]
MSNWIEVNIQVTHEAVEAVSDILVSVGAHGVAVEDPQLINDLRNSGTWELCDIPEQENAEIVTVSAYYADDEKLQGRLAQIEDELNVIEERIGKFRFGNTCFRTVSEVDWANEWKQYFHVTHVGESLVIKPSWEEYEAKEGEHVIKIDPGM